MFWFLVTIAIFFVGIKYSDSTMILAAGLFAIASSIFWSRQFSNSNSEKK